MNEIYLGQNVIKSESKSVNGEFVEIENEKFYKISNYNQMADFFMTVVSDSDHWMFLSSNGSLSAGRKNSDNALFPYYTVDKIHDYRDITGSRTYCLIEKNNKTYLWEPFSINSEKVYAIERNLYKSIYGNKIIFEEVNSDLEVTFQYGWHNSERFGWIKKSKVTNHGSKNVVIKLLDGLRNILPSGIGADFQNAYSNLLDAYKKNELLNESGIGLFILSSIPVDKAEPSEALIATTVWAAGLDGKIKILISDNQVENFLKGLAVEKEVDIRASRGAYYVNPEFVLGNREKKEWYLLAEVNQDSTDVANLDFFIRTTENITELVKKDIDAGTSNLIKVVANADGMQVGNEELAYARHFSNTLYNIMRGGVFANNYTIDINDFLQFVTNTNKKVSEQFKPEIEKLSGIIQYPELTVWAKQFNNADFERICNEYLPLSFSRRHGDPSRPWNRFSIETRNQDGSNKLSYEGNWRDIFQNWEALSLSFPEYTEGMISKFLNASTADGYNPYRIARDGIDWEKSDPDDPWSYIGYWGDHQIVYLQKLLEQSNNFNPGKLDVLLTKEIFVYANVPYRIKSFDDIVRDPKNTITFDFRLDKEIESMVQQVGADGKLLFNENGEIIKANLLEKVLVVLLSKLSNFIPEAGIWLNTQRPEWNDANNALVGNGVSMVTLYCLRRFLKFWENKFNSILIDEINISEEIKIHFDKTYSIFAENKKLLETGLTDESRFYITSCLGRAGADYRRKIYNHSFSGNKFPIQLKTLNKFIGLSLKYIDQSIQKNMRKDGLYHAYNLISFMGNRLSIRYLYEMLEGQVAVLSSGYLSAEQSLKVLDALKQSKLFREDQYSYILYPDRQLPRFVEKNNIAAKRVEESVLLQTLIADKNTSILSKDGIGNYHFNGLLRNAIILKEELAKLEKAKYGELVQKEKNLILNMYEEIFDHQSFTGRSGTFYGYEGLGSIYWHMASKLLLATQECYLKGISEKANSKVLKRLKDHYNEIKAGIGLYKSPDLYGAFPTDAYSHTPANAGVKQPGLTGQVKEDILSRFGELGIQLNNGKITFNTSLLNHDEFLKQEEAFCYFDLKGEKKCIQLKPKQLGLTLCQVPIICNLGNEEKIMVVYANGEKQEIMGDLIPQGISQKIFRRTGEVKFIMFNSPGKTI